MIGFMMRNLMLAILLVLAIGVPYLMHSDGVKSVISSLSIPLPGSSKNRSEATDREIAALMSGPTTESEAPAGAMPTGPEVQDIQLAIRFSITPQWVMQHWSRVSVVQIDGMQAYRVPFVSGLQMHDVAGSLTYCFNDAQQLQRITFRGVTGDPGKMQKIATRGFGLENEGGFGGLYVARWNGQPTSYMLIENSAIVRADSPLTRFNVKMELNRPTAQLKVSREMKREVASRTHVDKRWRW